MRFVAGRGAVAKRLVRGAAVAERHREEAAGKGAHKNHNREKLGKRLRDYVSAIKIKQGELPCYSLVHLSGRRSR